MPRTVVAPRIRGFLSMSSHPDGCAANVGRQADIAKDGAPGAGLKNVLVVGSSTGYGLASLLVAAFGYGADTLGICFEKPADAKRTATAGWYNLAAAHQLAKAAGRKMETINGDAFSHEIKAQAIAALKERFGKIDMVVYSLASPRRKDPNSDTIWNSVLKPKQDTFTSKTIDLRSHEITAAAIEPCSDQEAADTIKVMGGEDWQLWIDALREADLLAAGCRTVAYSYIGPQVTYPVYRSGTIGSAKEHLEATAKTLDAQLQELGGNAWVSVNKALVTQASAAIPVVPLYISILFDVMKEKGNHEGTIEQIVRLFKDHIGPGATPTVDEAGRIRVDDWELADDIQAEVDRRWELIATDNLDELADFQGFQDDFAALFGFGLDGVDYEAETETERELA